MKTATLPLALAAAVSALLLGACSTAPDAGTQPRADAGQGPAAAAGATSTAQAARVVLAPASGSLVSGTLELRPTGNGVHLRGEIGGLGPNGTHAIHIHEKGDCSAADASSAGGHFNPAGAPHGKVDRGAHHAGDMDNIVADAEGVAKVDVHASGVTLGGGAANDVAGKAVIVHAAADDYTTQPTGNAGGRLACGVIAVTR
ncbi:superoxide dismutase family protein [Vulcaniibacterium tengchongense]|uniref:Superoxide dismutase [Cu-Zn] n=1 Tax=Vulcaniibacterium tengchongense TaxID=1273429 RepID=A0A3N4VSH3_9GAMM|nr:superoxide dismutase family protein [Vulcaniibacterium tengchongense]RPE80027.1 Cu-Zn family superoxide dismutase [Vulcaniibacterium tengchongense]